MASGRPRCLGLVGARLPAGGIPPSHRRGARGRGGVGRFVDLFFPCCPAEEDIRRRKPRNPRARSGHPGEPGLDRVRPRRARLGNPRPAGSIPRGAGPSNRHRLGRDADCPQESTRERLYPVRHSRASGGSRTPGSRRCLRSMSPSSPCCSWCRRGERRGHRGTTKRTTPSRTGCSVVPVVAGRRSSRCHRLALPRGPMPIIPA